MDGLLLMRGHDLGWVGIWTHPGSGWGQDPDPSGYGHIQIWPIG